MVANIGMGQHSFGSDIQQSFIVRILKKAKDVLMRLNNLSCRKKNKLDERLNEETLFIENRSVRRTALDFRISIY
jgi:hypothetical protein